MMKIEEIKTLRENIMHNLNTCRYYAHKIDKEYIDIINDGFKDSKITINGFSMNYSRKELENVYLNFNNVYKEDEESDIIKSCGYFMIPTPGGESEVIRVLDLEKIPKFEIIAALLPKTHRTIFLKTAHYNYRTTAASYVSVYGDEDVFYRKLVNKRAVTVTNSVIEW